MKTYHVNHTPVWIVSACRDNLTDEVNNQRHTKAKLLLIRERISYKEVFGSYQGSLERSFVIPAGPGVRCIVSQIAAHFNQECVLFLDQERNAFVCSPECFLGEQLPGKFRPLDAQFLNNYDGWTYDPAFEVYYSVY